MKWRTTLKPFEDKSISNEERKLFEQCNLNLQLATITGTNLSRPIIFLRRVINNHQI